MNEPTARGRQANERAPIRHRWTAKPPGDSEEALAGALLRTAKAVQPWPTRNLAEVAARLRSRERHVPRKWAWQIAIAVGLLGPVLYWLTLLIEKLFERLQRHFNMASTTE